MPSLPTRTMHPGDDIAARAVSHPRRRASTASATSPARSALLGRTSVNTSTPSTDRSLRHGGTAVAARRPGWGRLVLLASIVVSFLAASSAPTPLYAIVVLLTLLVLGRVSDHIARRPVLLTALAVQKVAMIVLTTAGGVDALLVGRGCRASPPAGRSERSALRCSTSTPDAAPWPMPPRRASLPAPARCCPGSSSSTCRRRPT